MIEDYRHEKRADKIINATGRTFNVYENTTGALVGIRPSDKSEVKEELTEDSPEKTYYAVTEEAAEVIRVVGGELDKIAVVAEKKEIGRGGVKISPLSWAKDRRTKIVFCG